MSKSTGLISRAWERIRCFVTKETFIGADTNGNKYYKWVEKNLHGEPVEKRRVRVPGNDFLYEPQRIPAEWRSWLAKTRSDPPTEAEMARSAERAAIMKQRVAALEEQEQQRRIRMETLGKQATTAAGPDISRFMSQLENKGYAAPGGTQAGSGPSSSRSEPHRGQQGS